MLELGVKFLVSYLVGSLMGGLLMGRLKGGVDIRQMGSGNAGSTNALRTQGAMFALGVFVIDIGKGVLAAGVIPYIELPFVPTDPEISRAWLAVCCGAAAVCGHVWPIYHRFKGGKGFATLLGTMIVLGPKLLVVMLLVWVLMLTMTGYVGLSTMTSVASLPIAVGLTGLTANLPLFTYGLFMAVFIAWCHRSNIERMRNGVEHRNTRVMLFKRNDATRDGARDADDAS